MSLVIAKTRRGIKAIFRSLAPETQGFFSDLPDLIYSEFSLDIVLAYLFFRLEQGLNQTLYCGARKLLKTEADLTRKALDIQFLTREKYLRFFQEIYGFPMDANIQGLMYDAEKIRDRVMHGKSVNDKERRRAISKVLAYCDRVNNFISAEQQLGFKPFCADIRGFSGRLPSHDKATSRLILKGIGLDLS
jgi:hypothetical protein